MKKLISVLIAIILCFAVCCAPVAAASASLNLSQAVILPGSRAKVICKMQGNPGVFGLMFTPQVTDAAGNVVDGFEITTENGDLFPDFTAGPNPMFFGEVETGDVKEDGRVCYFIISAPADAAEGEYVLALNGLDACNFDEETIEYAVNAGKISVLASAQPYEEQPDPAATPDPPTLPENPDSPADPAEDEPMSGGIAWYWYAVAGVLLAVIVVLIVLIVSKKKKVSDPNQADR